MSLLLSRLEKLCRLVILITGGLTPIPCPSAALNAGSSFGDDDEGVIFILYIGSNFGDEDECDECDECDREKLRSRLPPLLRDSGD